MAIVMSHNDRYGQPEVWLIYCLYIYMYIGRERDCSEIVDFSGPFGPFGSKILGWTPDHQKVCEHSAAVEVSDGQ